MMAALERRESRGKGDLGHRFEVVGAKSRKFIAPHLHNCPARKGELELISTQTLSKVLLQGIEEACSTLSPALPPWRRKPFTFHHILILLLQLYHLLDRLYDAVAAARNSPGDLSSCPINCHSYSPESFALLLLSHSRVSANRRTVFLRERNPSSSFFASSNVS